MRKVLSQIINSFLLTSLILCVPSSATAKSGNTFPYHLDKTVEKQKIYNYSFEDVWERALTVLKEMESVYLNNFREQGIKSVKSIVKSDKSSGIMTLSLTHKGEKGFFSERESLFYHQVILLKPLDKQRTSALSHEIKFMSYDRYIFHTEQLARYVDLTPSSINILDEIQLKLKERDAENR